MQDQDFRISVFRKASLCRNFESTLYKKIEEKHIKLPTYLSAGQEYISAVMSVCFRREKPFIFGQHRCHSLYLSFGGDVIKLIDELLGRETGCAYGMGGSASIHSPEINMYGHDGLMGSQVPIAVGSCFSNKKPTIAIMGDASAEEDYTLGALGWASTKGLPILFIVEDNNLSILTEKKVRRNWEMDAVAQSFNITACQVSDDPIELREKLNNAFSKPMLLNVNTHRLFWHAGAGRDSEETFDRYKYEMESIGSQAEDIHFETKNFVEETWQKQLEKQ